MWTIHINIYIFISPIRIKEIHRNIGVFYEVAYLFFIFNLNLQYMSTISFSLGYFVIFQGYTNRNSKYLFRFYLFI